MEKLLVTGAAGFIGFHLCEKLLTEGYQVVGIDNLNGYYDVQLKNDRLKKLKLHDDFTFHKVDIANAESIDKTFSFYGVSTVYHLAAQAGVRYSISHPHEYTQTNIEGFLNILEFLPQIQYGTAKQPIQAEVLHHIAFIISAITSR